MKKIKVYNLEIGDEINIKPPYGKKVVTGAPFYISFNTNDYEKGWHVPCGEHVFHEKYIIEG